MRKDAASAYTGDVRLYMRTAEHTRTSSQAPGRKRYSLVQAKPRPSKPTAAGDDQHLTGFTEDEAFESELHSRREIRPFKQFFNRYANHN